LVGNHTFDRLMGDVGSTFFGASPVTGRPRITVITITTDAVLTG
jgi:hypothetical protein